MTNSVADRLAKKTRRRSPAKQVRLKLVYLDFWSAVKFSFIVSLCSAIVWVVFAVLIFLVLQTTGVFGRLDSLFMDIVDEENSLAKYIGLPQVTIFAVVVGALNTIVGTALGAVGALIYNLLVRAVGGFQLGFVSN